MPLAHRDQRGVLLFGNLADDFGGPTRGANQCLAGVEADGARCPQTALDKDLDAAVRDDESADFTARLHAAVALVRASGTPLAADEIVTADYILPFSDATIEEVRKLLADGTISGDSIGLP